MCSPHDPVPDAQSFCPWCGLLLPEHDCEDDGRFTALLRCPRCRRSTTVLTDTHIYDYGRALADLDVLSDLVHRQVLLTASWHAAERQRWEEVIPPPEGP